MNEGTVSIDKPQRALVAVGPDHCARDDRVGKGVPAIRDEADGADFGLVVPRRVETPRDVPCTGAEKNGRCRIGVRATIDLKLVATVDGKDLIRVRDGTVRAPLALEGTVIKQGVPRQVEVEGDNAYDNQCGDAAPIRRRRRTRGIVMRGAV